MKLHEIIEEYHSSSSGGPPVNIKKDINITSRKIGSGIQGVAYKHPKQPNVIIKTAKMKDPQTDPYANFIRMVLKHQDNPFFPRIYSAKIYNTPNSNDYTMVVTMEKLYPVYRNPKLDDIVIDNFQLQGIDIKQVTDLFDYLHIPKNRYTIAKKTRNPKLREAFELLEPLFELPGTFMDMHHKNWMMRLTGVGPQLVIVDPVFGD
jgi:hypothetical protein